EHHSYISIAFRMYGVGFRESKRLYVFEFPFCPKLTYFDVAGCSSLSCLWLNGSAVTNLDLSGSEFKNLSDLDVTGCTSLTALNVDGCAALENLRAPYTAVTKLNLTNNPELTDLFLNETQLTELDLKNNTKLKSLSLVGVANLANLEIAEGVELEEFELTDSKITSFSYAGNEKITELDMSSNVNMTYLNLAGCSSLEKLEANGCEKLTELNLAECAGMKEIYLNGAGIKTLDARACTKLVSLDVSACADLTSLNVKGCALAFLNVTGCKSLAELDCSNNSLGYLNLDDLTALSTANYSGQKIYGWTPDKKMKLGDYIGNNDISRVVEVLAYDSNGDGIRTTIEDENGNVYKADTEYYATFESVPEKVVYYYDTKFSGGELMDVTLASESTEHDTENDENIETNTTSGSGGGCNLVRSEAGASLAELGMRSVLIFLMLFLALALSKKISNEK
ncbi:MAG: hypothetical protein IJ597_01140, partial [Synergistaceae bacterium]|nr:hypothetical protein [Synergistaceae bacterium]